MEHGMPDSRRNKNKRMGGSSPLPPGYTPRADGRQTGQRKARLAAAKAAIHTTDATDKA